MRTRNTLAFLVVIGLSVLTAVLVMTSASDARLAVEAPRPIDNAVAMHRLGLDQEALAVIGADEDAATSIAQHLISSYMSRHGALQVLDASVGAAKRTISELERLIRSGKAGDEAINQLAAARVQLQSVTAEREALLSILYQDATVEIEGPALSTLATIKTNRHWGLPIAYLTTTRTEREWVDLRTALACARIEADGGSPINEQSQAILAQAHLDPAYIAAATNLSLYADDVALAWEATIGVD